MVIAERYIHWRSSRKTSNICSRCIRLEAMQTWDRWTFVVHVILLSYVLISFDLISESYLTILYHLSAKCIIVKGHSSSMRREDLKKVKSREECIYLVAYTRPTASGMTFRTRDKNCWAEFGTTGTNGHNGYESCKFNRNFYQINSNQFHNLIKSLVLIMH